MFLLVVFCSKKLQRFLEILGERRVKGHSLAGFGMGEGELYRVESLAVKELRVLLLESAL